MLKQQLMQRCANSSKITSEPESWASFDSDPLVESLKGGRIQGMSMIFDLRYEFQIFGVSFRFKEEFEPLELCLDLFLMVA